ncbi:hypothetical protein BGZ46_006048 [Entomortierella lignicola]|nr:hypothetical protein BGZ46_006048 [Entomortierella lignicola]
MATQHQGVQALDVLFFLQGFREFKYSIARNLAGALIQIGSQVILILKVEIYGRDPADDPHLTTLVKSVLDFKEVTTMKHDNVVKLGSHNYFDSEPEEIIDASVINDLTDAEILRQTKIDLDVSTSSKHLSNCIMEKPVPFTVEYESGPTSSAFLPQDAAKRAVSERVIDLRPMKKPKTQVFTEPHDLGITLASSRCGELIDINDYNL